MNNAKWCGLVWACVAWGVQAQTVPLESHTVSVLPNQQLICVEAQRLDAERTGVDCSYYTMVSQHTSWPWLNEAIEAHLKQAMPVLNIAHVPVPPHFDAQKDWQAERHYHVDDIVRYHGVVNIHYGGWDYWYGTPHGNPYGVVEVWDEARREVVGLNEVIAPEHHAAVLALLQRQNEGDSELDLWMDNWPHDMVLSPQYSVSAKGMTFHYGLYELGTYLLGTPALTVSWEAVRPYVKSPWQQRFGQP